MAHGKFVWYELMTTDTKAAEAFYSDVIGWDAQDAGMPGMSYTILSAGEVPHRRVDGRAQGGPRCRCTAGLDGLCRGRRCR